MAPSSVHATLASPGQPLAPSVRAYFEPRFGADLSQVRVHTDGQAQQSAREVHAQAYAAGTHLVFAAGRYAPETFAGKHLLAHELAHVAQQAQHEGAAPPALRRVPDRGGIERQPPRYAYSTYCGWIDWSHAQPGLMAGLISAVRAASNRLAATPGASAETITGPAMESAPGGLVLSSATPVANVKRALSEEEVLRVALRIFMEQSERFESAQSWTDWIGQSSFSEEDLPSNLLGFYQAARGFDRQDIETYCDARDAADSLARFENHTFSPTTSWPNPQSWPSWPPELSDIQPADPHGPLMDMVSIRTETLFGGPRTQDLLGPSLIADPALHLALINDTSPIDISSDDSGPAGAPTFEVRPVRPSSLIRYRWGIRDANDIAYAMWSEGGQVHQFGPQRRAYIGSRTRALLRERNIRQATVRCRLAAGGTDRLLTFDVAFTWS
jgi:hypothetical protein